MSGRELPNWLPPGTKTLGGVDVGGWNLDESGQLYVDPSAAQRIAPRYIDWATTGVTVTFVDTAADRGWESEEA